MASCGAGEGEFRGVGSTRSSKAQTMSKDTGVERHESAANIIAQGSQNDSKRKRMRILKRAQ